MSEGYVFGRAHKKIKTELGKKALRGELLSKHTTWRVGGPAGVFVIAENISHLRMILKVASEFNLPFFVVGRGSNLLVSDEGFNGIVITLGGDFWKMSVEDNQIRAGAAVTMPHLAFAAYRAGFSSLAFTVGIPGSLGGAVCTNAGAYGAQVGDFITQLTLYTTGYELKSINGKDIGFGYRTSSIASKGIIVEVVLRLEKGRPVQTRVEMEKYFAQRKQTQPLDCPTAGSVFKNPAGKSAGKLIEEAGCKGLRVGLAQVSTKHANFIINLGGATARNIYDLMQEVRRIVQEKKGISLEPEVTLVGNFDAKEGS